MVAQMIPMQSLLRESLQLLAGQSGQDRSTLLGPAPPDSGHPQVAAGPPKSLFHTCSEPEARNDPLSLSRDAEAQEFSSEAQNSPPAGETECPFVTTLTQGRASPVPLSLHPNTGNLVYLMFPCSTAKTDVKRCQTPQEELV